MYKWTLFKIYLSLPESIRKNWCRRLFKSQANQHQSTSVNPLIHASPHYDRYDRAFRLELVSSNLQHWLLDSIRDGPIENKPIKNQNHFSQPETHVMFSDSRHIMRTEFDTSTIRQFIMGSAPVSPGSWEVKGHLTKKFCSQGGFSENTPNKGVHHHFSSNVGQICRGIVRIFGSWLKSKWNNVVKTVSINHPPVITIFIGGMYKLFPFMSGLWHCLSRVAFIHMDVSWTGGTPIIHFMFGFSMKSTLQLC